MGRGVFREGGGRGLAAGVSHLCQGCSPARGDARLWLLARSPHRLFLSIHSFATFSPHPPWLPTLYLPHSILSLCGNPVPFESRKGGGGMMGLACHGSDGVSALTEAFHHVFVAVCTPALESPHLQRSLGVCIVLYRPVVQRLLSAHMHSNILFIWPYVRIFRFLQCKAVCTDGFHVFFLAPLQN